MQLRIGADVSRRPLLAVTLGAAAAKPRRAGFSADDRELLLLSRRNIAKVEGVEGMTISRAGSNKKYAEGWERAFGRKARSSNSAQANNKTKAAKTRVASAKKAKKTKKKGK